MRNAYLLRPYAPCIVYPRAGQAVQNAATNELTEEGTESFEELFANVGAILAADMGPPLSAEEEEAEQAETNELEGGEEGIDECAVPLFSPHQKCGLKFDMTHVCDEKCMKIASNALSNPGCFGKRGLQCVTATFQPNSTQGPVTYHTNHTCAVKIGTV